MPRPLLQLALDTFDLPSALAPLQQAADSLDIIEVGTILCLAEGMHAVRVIRSLFPQKTVLADVRIAEAGAIISRMCYEAGADWVSVVSGAAPITAEVVLKEARSRPNCDVQIELSDGWTWDKARAWRELGIRQVITHRSRDGEVKGESAWSSADFDTIHQLSDLGFQVSVAGSLKLADIAAFQGVPVHVFIVGRAISGAEDPAGAARQFRTAIHALDTTQPQQAE